VRDFDGYLDFFNVESIPNLKGGFYFFDSSDAASEVFETARDIYNIRDDVGLTSFKNAPIADEAVIGTALALCGIEALPLEGAPVNTFLGQTEPVDVNVLQGGSQFIKAGRLREPTSIHFPIGTQDSFCYLRDMNRLELQDSLAAEWRAQLRGRGEAVSRTLRQKWSNVRGRVGEMGILGVLPGRILRQFDLLPQRNARS
jgi:hypothetical protein